MSAFDFTTTGRIVFGPGSRREVPAAAAAFGGPIGGGWSAPHGAVCARLLPGLVAANLADAL